MEKLIEEEVGGRKLEEVDELILDECECTQISGLTDEFVNLEKLSMVSCGLTTLKGFPNLPNLRKLDLSNNKLGDNELSYLVGCQSLTHLNLNANDIKEITSLEPLKKLKNLRKLDLLSCAVSDVEQYREKVFELLEQIIFLDGLDREEQQDEDDSDEDGLEGEDDEGEGDDDDDDDENDGENSEGSDEDGAGGDPNDEDYDDGEEEGHSRGTKRKHQDEEDV